MKMKVLSLSAASLAATGAQAFVFGPAPNANANNIARATAQLSTALNNYARWSPNKSGTGRKDDGNDTGGDTADEEEVDGETSLTLKLTEDVSAGDAVKKLRPYVLRVKDVNAEVLQDCLNGMGFLDVKSVSRNKENILKEMGRIYAEAREQEGKSLETNKDGIVLSYCEAAIEIRNAILYSELKDIGDGMEVYEGLVPDLANSGMKLALTQVLIRPQDKAFWGKCIELSLNRPVCGWGILVLEKQPLQSIFCSISSRKDKSLWSTLNANREVKISFMNLFRSFIKGALLTSPSKFTKWWPIPAMRKFLL